MRVFIYYNLHKKCLSVKALTGESKGRVIAHCTSVSIENAEFVVSEAGRARVLKERRKNVHAGVRGELIDHTLLGFGPLELPKGQWRAVTYDPYKYATFVDKNTAEAVLNAAKVLILDKKVYANIG